MINQDVINFVNALTSDEVHELLEERRKEYKRKALHDVQLYGDVVVSSLRIADLGTHADTVQAILDQTKTAWGLRSYSNPTATAATTTATQSALADSKAVEQAVHAGPKRRGRPPGKTAIKEYNANSNAKTKTAA